MGKSKYDKLTYTGKREADKRMAEQYGVDLEQYGNTERPGASYSGKKSWDELSGDVAAAAANDYDVRRSIEAAQASGNKKAQKIGSISNASEAYAATRFMEKTHKNRMENTGNYDGANDQGNVTKYWNDKANNSLMDKIDALSNHDDEQTNTAITPDDNVEYAESQQSKDAKATLDKWMTGLGPGGSLSPYGANSASAPETPSPYGEESSTPVTTDVDEFVSGYKDDVKSAYRFKPTL